MSLINQALRKAQHDRTPNRMPEPEQANVNSYVNSVTKTMSPALVIGLVITVAALIGLVIGLSIVIFKDKSPQAQQIAPLSLPNPTNQGNATSAPLAQQIPLSTMASSSGSEQDLVEPSLVEQLRKAREAAESKVAAQAKAEEEAAARLAAKPSEETIDWLAQAKLSGVKISENNNMIILNGKTYSTGEYVNLKLGLKIMVIQQTRVLFVDDNGKKYIKRL